MADSCVLLTRSRCTCGAKHGFACTSIPLACVRPVTRIHPEPGSNSFAFKVSRLVARLQLISQSRVLHAFNKVLTQPLVVYNINIGTVVTKLCYTCTLQSYALHPYGCENLWDVKKSLATCKQNYVLSSFA